MAKAARLMAEAHLKGENKTQGMILAEAGYAPRVAATPQRVTRSEAFLTLFHSLCSPERVAEAQQSLVVAGELHHKDFPLSKKPSPAELKIEANAAKADIEAVPGAVWRRYRLVNVPFVGLSLRAYYVKPDYKARATGLDQLHKVAGSYAPVKNDNRNLHFSLADLRALEEGKMPADDDPPDKTI